MTSPVDPEVSTWLAVPLIELTAEVDPVALIVMDPPKETAPPPVKPEPVLIVIELEDSAEVGISEKVFEDPERVLLVRVWEVVSITKLALAERVGIDAVKAPEPPGWVEIVVLPSLSWFDWDVKSSVPPESVSPVIAPAAKDPKVTSESASNG